MARHITTAGYTLQSVQALFLAMIFILMNPTNTYMHKEIALIQQRIDPL
jgi:hypothetical protein